MQVVAIYKPDYSSKMRLPLYTCRISAGSPSPADDYIEDILDLNDLIAHPDETFILRVAGDSMIGVGIFDNDLLLVDRIIEPVDDSIVVASIDGELTVKRLRQEKNRVTLLPLVWTNRQQGKSNRKARE
ncbi:S24 family peptidase, partial [Tumidithrix elongata RA019]|nr:S24 family peptidase [Tumidithrix elongata RA019]